MFRPRNARVALTLAALFLLQLTGGRKPVPQAGATPHSAGKAAFVAEPIGRPEASSSVTLVAVAPASSDAAADMPWYALAPWEPPAWEVDRGMTSGTSVTARLTTEAGLAAEEASALDWELPRDHGGEGDPVVVQTDADGSIIVLTGRRFEHRLVARIAGDGGIEIGCEDSDGAHAEHAEVPK